MTAGSQANAHADHYRAGYDTPTDRQKDCVGEVRKDRPGDAVQSFTRRL